MFVEAGSSYVLDACSEASAGCGGSVIEVSFAACAGAPVATVSGTPGSPPIVPGSFRPHPIQSAPTSPMHITAILISSILRRFVTRAIAERAESRFVVLLTAGSWLPSPGSRVRSGLARKPTNSTSLMTVISEARDRVTPGRRSGSFPPSANCCPERTCRWERNCYDVVYRRFSSKGERMKLWLEGKRRRLEEGKVGWVLLWLLGIPIPVLLVLFLLRGCT